MTIVSTSVARRRWRSGERGAELIEFALILPLILMLLMGIFDFGLAFQRYEVLTNAAREGARMGSLASDYTTTDIQARVKDYCDAANLPATACVADDVDVTNEPVTIAGEAKPGVRVTVSFEHEFMFLGPVLALINGSLDSVTLSASSWMRGEGAMGGEEEVAP